MSEMVEENGPQGPIPFTLELTNSFDMAFNRKGLAKIQIFLRKVTHKSMQSFIYNL